VYVASTFMLTLYSLCTYFRRVFNNNNNAVQFFEISLLILLGPNFFTGIHLAPSPSMYLKPTFKPI